MIITQIGTYNRSEMVTGYGTPFAIPPRRSNSVCYLYSTNKYVLFSCIEQVNSELGSSVSIVSGYGLDDRAINFRSTAGAKDFSSSLCVQTDSVARPASCTMGTGGPFPGAKAWLGRDADHSPPSIAEVEN
jgi:hypothetical protein